MDFRGSGEDLIPTSQTAGNNALLSRSQVYALISRLRTVEREDVCVSERFSAASERLQIARRIYLEAVPDG
jgi:hypothetical protein